jgi:hypothetical protein
MMAGAQTARNEASRGLYDDLLVASLAAIDVHAVADIDMGKRVTKATT